MAATPDNEFDPSMFSGDHISVIDVQISIAQALAPVVDVRMLADAEQERWVKTEMERKGVDTSIITFVDIPHCDIWLRDTGPIWGSSEDGVSMVWQGFNNWGYLPYIEGDWASCDIPNMIPRNLADHLGLRVHRTSLIGEGGNKSFNGTGSLICCQAVETNRNPNLSLEEIEARLKTSFGVTNIVWVEQGLAEDTQTFNVKPEYSNATLPGGVFTPLCTGGHIDEYCRFVGKNKVLLAQIHPDRLDSLSPIEKITHFNMEANLHVLKRQKDEEGNPLEVVRIPMPPSMIYQIDERDPVYDVIKNLTTVNIAGPIEVVLASSYCNYTICNGVICFPAYWYEGQPAIVKKHDDAALAVIQSCFPDHKIVQLDPRPLNAGGGGMHCITNNQPAALS